MFHFLVRWEIDQVSITIMSTIPSQLLYRNAPPTPANDKWQFKKMYYLIIPILEMKKLMCRKFKWLVQDKSRHQDSDPAGLTTA